MLTKKIAIVAVGLTLGLGSGCAAADAQGVDVQRLTPDAPQVASATIVLTPPGLRTRVALTEAALLGSGCHFATDGNNIAEIIDIFKYRLKDTQGDPQHFALRNAVYFRPSDGTTIRYLFSDATDRDTLIRGWADRVGGGSYTPFLAKGGLLADLQRWVRNDSIEKKDGTWCVQNR